VLGRHDTSLFMKAQMDNLQGRNDELRLALREIRHEANKSTLELEKATEKVGSYIAKYMLISLIDYNLRINNLSVGAFKMKFCQRKGYNK